MFERKDNLITHNLETSSTYAAIAATMTAISSSSTQVAIVPV